MVERFAPEMLMPIAMPCRRPGLWSRCATVLALLGAAATAGAADTLVVGTKECPPFAMVNGRTGEWSGISIDLWERIAVELGYQTEYRSLPLDELLDSVAAGEIDVALAALTVTADREREADFTHPYYQSNLAIALTEDAERLEPINLALLEITASADWQAIRRRYLGDGP